MPKYRDFIGWRRIFYIYHNRQEIYYKLKDKFFNFYMVEDEGLGAYRISDSNYL